MAQSMVPDFAFAPCRFYDQALTQHVCGSVALLYRGTGSYRLHKQTVPITGGEGGEYKLKLSPNDQAFYCHHFITQSAEQLILRRHPLGYGEWLVTPPKHPERASLNLLPMLGYGGYAKPGMALKDIEQVFAHIGQTGDQTSLDLKTYSELVTQRVAPPHGGSLGTAQVVYDDDFSAYQVFSIAEAIYAGQVVIELFKDEEVRQYTSHSYQAEETALDLITILFK